MKDRVDKARLYLQEQVPEQLKMLNKDIRPEWGMMTAQHMLEHLIVTFKMSLGKINLPVVTQEEKLEKVRLFLISDKPMQRSVPSPIGKNELQPLRAASLDEAKEKLIHEIKHYIDFVEKNPGFVANHPYGGPMNAEEWLCFHKKHFVHHFTQFGLI